MAGFIIGAIFGGIVGASVGGGSIGWILGGAFFGGLMGLGTAANQDAENRHKREVESLLKDIKENKKN